MAQKKTPHVSDGSAFGVAVHGQANAPKVGFFLTDYQTAFLCRRTRLRPEIARIVAPFVFGGGTL